MLSHIAANGGFISAQRPRPDSVTSGSSRAQTPLADFRLPSETDAIQRQSYLQRHPQQLPNLLGKLFVFAFTWAFGGTLTDCGYGEESDGLADFVEYRSNVSMVGFVDRGSWGGGPKAAFDTFVRGLFNCDPPIGVKFPFTPHTIFSYYVDMDTGNFVRWQDLVPSPSSLIGQSLSVGDSNSTRHWLKRMSLFQFDPSTETSRDMPIVPTVDTLRFSFLLNLLVLRHQPVLITGGVGVGKSSLVRHALNFMQEESTSVVSSVMGGLLGAAGLLPYRVGHSRQQDEVKIESKTIRLSAISTTGKLQTQLENCMVKLRRNAFGSPEGRQVG